MNSQDAFELPITVRGYEMDAFGHVNNAVYVQYFEHCRWMALKQWSEEFTSGQAGGIVVKKLTVEYEAPARVFDELVVRLWVDAVGRTSVTFGQDLRRRDDDSVVAQCEVVAVCVDAAGTPCPVPDSLRREVGNEDS